jgi:hypothetical protein
MNLARGSTWAVRHPTPKQGHDRYDTFVYRHWWAAWSFATIDKEGGACLAYGHHVYMYVNVDGLWYCIL